LTSDRQHTKKIGGRVKLAFVVGDLDEAWGKRERGEDAAREDVFIYCTYTCLAGYLIEPSKVQYVWVLVL